MNSFKDRLWIYIMLLLGLSFGIWLVAKTPTVSCATNETFALSSAPAPFSPDISAPIFKKEEPKKAQPVAKKTSNKFWAETTAYCACMQCCGKTDGITASGVKAVQGVTVAADTSRLPFGTKLHIDGVGERIVQDRGGAIKGNRIDIYFDNHQEALQYGRRKVEVTIVNR